MTSLPRALEPWRSSLESLAPDLVGGFSPLVQRLALAIGPYPAQSRRGDGEPDGYDGLARRGLYDRLLATEWLLASELPDEFLRRASSGEHAFLQLAQTVPSGGRRSLALFDCGPSQLGTPRIAHLAALIVLAHRAERAKVAFAWGILQLPEAALIENVSESSVRALLAARSTEEATEAHLRDWHDRLDDEEVWTVGTRLGERSIAVEDVLVPKARQLEVTVKKQRLRLELPPDGDCTRLLRDPYRVAVASPSKERPLPSRPVGNPVFSADGKRIIVGLENGWVVVQSLPTSARMQPGRPGVFYPPQGEKLVAAGGRQGQVWIVTVGSDYARLIRLGKRGGVAAQLRVAMKELPSAGPPFGTLIVHGGNLDAHPVDPGPTQYTFTDARGRLFHVTNGETSYGDAVALVGESSRATWVDGESWNEKRRRVCVSNDLWSWERHKPELGAPGPAEAYFAADVLRSQLIAAIRQGDEWAMVRLKRENPYVEMTLHPSGHARVVGALLHPPSLVLLDEGRRSLSVVSRNLSRVLVQSSREMQAVTVSLRGTHVAWLNEEGTLTVMALGTQEIVLRLEAP